MASYEPLSAIATEQQLEERLSRPDESVCQTMAQMEGDLIILGAGGKMGPTLAPHEKKRWQRTRESFTTAAIRRAPYGRVRADDRSIGPLAGKDARRAWEMVERYERGVLGDGAEKMR